MPAGGGFGDRGMRDNLRCRIFRRVALLVKKRGKIASVDKRAKAYHGPVGFPTAGRYPSAHARPKQNQGMEQPKRGKVRAWHESKGGEIVL